MQRLIYDLSQEVDSCVENFKSAREEKIIEEIVNTINSSKNNCFSSAHHNIKISGEYLHGPNSQSKFIYGPTGNTEQRELCDLLIISTVSENGVLKNQRVSFVQAKKGGNSRSYKIDDKQLFLLTSFPEFTGYSGLFKNQKVKLEDMSGALGSFLFFTPCLEFSWVTSLLVNLQFSSHKKLKLSQFNAYFANPNVYRHPGYWHDREYPWNHRSQEALPNSFRFFEGWLNHTVGEFWNFSKGTCSNPSVAKFVKGIVSQSNLNELKRLFDDVRFDNRDDDNLKDQEQPEKYSLGIISVITEINVDKNNLYSAK
jgi:hypothetical protein